MVLSRGILPSAMRLIASENSTNREDLHFENRAWRKEGHQCIFFQRMGYVHWNEEINRLKTENAATRDFAIFIVYLIGTSRLKKHSGKALHTVAII
jgi:hypothetical protein